MSRKVFALVYSFATVLAVNPPVNNDGTPYTGTLPRLPSIDFDITFSDAVSTIDPHSGLTFYTSTVSIDTTNLSGIYKLSQTSWDVKAPAIYAPFINETDTLILATNSTDMVSDVCESLAGQMLAAVGMSGFLTYPSGMQSATGGFLTPEEYDAKYSITSLLPTVLPAPTGFALTAGDTQASLSWDSVDGASYYEVYRSTTSGDDGSLVGSPTSTTFVDTGLTKGRTYLYAVAAIASDLGEGIHCAQLSCTF